MKRYIYCILSILSAAILASCTKNQEISEPEQSMNVSITFETKAGGSGSGTVQEPVINCMRVLIFYGDPAGSETVGNLVFNTFYAFGFNTTKETGKYTVKLANQIVLPQSDCRNYNVYVILNEEDYQLAPVASPVNLHTKLGNFEGTETALQTILNTPAVYAEVLKNVDEPAFLISGRKAVTFDSGALGSGKTVEVVAATGNPSAVDDYNRGRSMAQIVINKITSEPADGVDYSSTDVPKIFVKSVTLENIPNSIAWADEEGKIGTVGSSTDWETSVTAMTAATVGSVNSDGYYNRDWYGHITRTITNLWAQKVQHTDAKFYRTASATDANKSKWSFSVKPYRTTDGTPGPGEAPYTYDYAHGKNIEPKNDAAMAENAVMAIGKWDNNAKNILIAQLPGVFDAMQDDNDEMSENISYTSYEVTGVQNETKTDNGVTTYKTEISPATLSDDYWTVRLGDKFYVPENIQTATTNATCLHVTLAIANPKFSFRLNKGKFDPGVNTKRVCTEDLNDNSVLSKNNYGDTDDYYVDPTTLPSPSSLPGESSLGYTYSATYFKEDKGVVTEDQKALNDIDGNWIKTYGSIAWADEPTHVLVSPTGDNYQDPDGLGAGQPGDHANGYLVYIDGFNRRTAAVQTGALVVNETLPGSSFSWNVPADDDGNTGTGSDNTTHVYDFVIPINNNIGGDGDYSVRRNTRYTVTLYVNKDTYTSFSSKAGEPAPFSITAKVTTETVDNDEE